MKYSIKGNWPHCIIHFWGRLNLCTTGQYRVTFDHVVICNTIKISVKSDDIVDKNQDQYIILFKTARYQYVQNG